MIQLIENNILDIVFYTCRSVQYTCNLLYFLSKIPSGVAVAAGVRVGWHLGANKPLTAKTAASTGMFITGITPGELGCCMTRDILLLDLHVLESLQYIFINFRDVIILASSLIPFICVYMFFDHMYMYGYYCMGVMEYIMHSLCLQTCVVY